MKDITDEALRRGLREMIAEPKTRKPFRTQAFDLGPFVVSIDNISEVLAYAEGEGFK